MQQLNGPRLNLWSGSMICDCGPPPCKFNVLWLSTANFQTIQICSHKHHTADCQIWLRHADKTSLILWQKIWILSWIGPPGGVVNSMPRTLYRPQGPWRYHVIGFVEDQEKVTNFKDQENMLLYYLLDVIVEISGYMKYKYMLCICCNCVCVYASIMLCVLCVHNDVYMCIWVKHVWILNVLKHSYRPILRKSTWAKHGDKCVMKCCETFL